MTRLYEFRTRLNQFGMFEEQENNVVLNETALKENNV